MHGKELFEVKKEVMAKHGYAAWLSVRHYIDENGIEAWREEKKRFAELDLMGRGLVDIKAHTVHALTTHHCMLCTLLTVVRALCGLQARRRRWRAHPGCTCACTTRTRPKAHTVHALPLRPVHSSHQRLTQCTPSPLHPVHSSH